MDESETNESRSSDWVFTINNPEPSEMNSIYSVQSEIKYLVYQFEKGESGTEHIQGYIEFNEGKTWHEVKEILGRRTAFKRRYGTRDGAREYCMKEETRLRGPWEIGRWIIDAEQSDTH